MSQGTLSLEIADDASRDMIVGLLTELDIVDTLHKMVSLQLTGTPVWSLTLTDDFPSTAARVFSDPGYTTDRGSGVSGARTGKLPDGTYHIVISVQALIPEDLESLTVEEARGFVVASAKHLGGHEALHIELSDRSESDQYFRELVVPPPFERLFWRNHVAVAIDEYRIERATRTHTPSPRSNLESLEFAAEALVESLDYSRRVAPQDFDHASSILFGAIHHFLTQYVYSIAEHHGGVSLPKLNGALVDIKFASLLDATEANLGSLPDAHSVTDIVALGRCATQLTDSLHAWVELLGIEPRMNPDRSYLIHWQ